MCGIAGFVGAGSENHLRAMTVSLRHRGPDNQQVFLKEGVGLGHSRLSIIDLSSEANQPFFSDDGLTAIVFNGEIYNFQELRKDLKKSKGHVFRTSSDTEVLLALYSYYGEALFDRLAGMFAFAIYDFKEKKLLLARDRMGEKPLYFSPSSNAFVFASELKALLNHPDVGREVDIQALHNYLILDYVPAPFSIFKNIYKLLPGHYLVYQAKTHVIKKYWDIRFSASTSSFDDACAEFTNRLEQSVRNKLIADVPLGVFLSGGLDSSSVAYFAQKNSSQKIKTYSIGFESKSYDESKQAKQVAEFLGTDHHSEILTEQEALRIIPTIGSQLDEPFADPSIIPTYLLSKFTRQHVTVALGGDGSDELLAGYPTFQADYFAKAMNTLPQLTDFFARLSLSILPASDKNIGLDFKIRQFRKGLFASEDQVHTLWLSSFTPKSAKLLWRDSLYSLLDNPGDISLIRNHLQNLGGASRFDRTSFIYYKTYLPDDILFKVDRASMLSSLEVRCPFLDHSFVEFTNSLPLLFKRKGFQTKRILKKSMEGKLPENIIHRPKKGFGIPLSAWLRGDLKQLCNDLLSESALAKHGFFNPKYIAKINTDHYAMRVNYRKELWNLMMFQLWYSNFVSR